MNQDVSTAEVEVLQSIGAALGKIGSKQTTCSSSLKDEDELFGALIASQLQQIAPERKVSVKMQVYNIYRSVSIILYTFCVSTIHYKFCALL